VEIDYLSSMKFFAAFAIFLLAAGLSSARAQQDADDQYIIIYSLLQSADTQAGAGHLQPALTQYTDVQNELLKFQKYYPDWNPKIVSFRLNYLAGKIAGLKAQMPAPVAASPAAAVTNVHPAPASVPAPEPAVVDDLRGQVQSLSAVNTTLQAKLKEALAAQPATIDPRELVKAQGKISELMKENELLKVSLSQGKTRTNIVNVAAQTDALKRAQAALADANKKLSEQIARADKLAQDNQSLSARLQVLLASPGALDAVREENALLKKQIAGLKIAATNSTSSAARLNVDLQSARLQIAALQSDAQVRQLEKTALENRLAKTSNAVVASPPVPVPAADQAANEARIRELTQERNDLLGKLGAANRELYGAKKQSAAAQIGDLNDQIKTLRARLAVDEALAVPYTPEELALFRSPSPQPVAVDATKKSIKELPAGSGQLVAEAQKYFAAKQYDKAEDNYQKILQRDENNTIALGNLATIEMEQGKLADAEKHLTTAVAQNPDDAYNLSMLGYLKFRQEKYDDALNDLSRAAKLDPTNPEIENYLGVTLSHKGLRVQAETALRKAVQLAPDYAAAHNNLAVIYINQTPPLVQLARWHYQKALAAGQPPNPDLEKALGGTFVPATTK
jgi:tetratricopeptide (TPR) repeat protein